MPSIGEMEYGYESGAVQNYLEDIKAIVLDQACEKVKDISAIKRVCDEKWFGTAKEKFIENLQRDADRIAEQYHTLQRILAREIIAVSAAMNDKDKNLIQ